MLAIYSVSLLLSLLLIYIYIYIYIYVLYSNGNSNNTNATDNSYHHIAYSPRFAAALAQLERSKSNNQHC